MITVSLMSTPSKLKRCLLATHYTATVPIISHAVSWMREQSWQVNSICCIYATSVFLTINDLKKGFDILNTGRWQYTFSATDFEYPIFRSIKNDSMAVWKYFSRNILKVVPRICPKPDAWINNLKMFAHHSFPVIIPRWRVQDIDTEDDWKRAELMFNEISESL